MEPVNLEPLRTISVLKAGELFGFGRTQTYARVREGTFPVLVRKIGNEYRVRVADLYEFYESLHESKGA